MAESAIDLRGGEHELIDGLALKNRLDAIGMDRPAGEPDRRRRVMLALKEAHAAAMAEAEVRLNAGVPGIAVARLISDAVDLGIEALYSYFVEHEYPPGNVTDAERLSVVAVGGYGRALMAPGSDIDLLFILPGKRTGWSEQMAESILYTLWDLGLTVGHSTRTIAEALRLSREDHTIRTTLLEARHVCGDRALSEALFERFWDAVERSKAAEFVAQKLAERDERHLGAGGTRYLVEPNIKESKGGLRDLHTLYWIAKFVYRAQDPSDLVDAGVLTAQEYNTFKRAEAFLWDVRCHLHFLAGRAEENLTFDLQPEMARRMGYGDGAEGQGVERFMRNYFLVAKDVGSLTRIICAHLELGQSKGWRSLGRMLPLTGVAIDRGTGFTVQNGRLAIETEDGFEKNPVRLISLFHLADRKRVDIHPTTLRQVTRSLDLIDDALRANEEANRLFMEVLTSRHDPERTLRQMNEAGVLGRFLPEFGRVVALMQFNMYHHYTVDEHILRVIGNLAAIERGELPEEHPVAHEIVHRIQSRRALYVGALYHDIAKGLPGDHSRNGADLVRSSGPRLGLTPSEIETAAWLVEHHIEMSDYAQKRDVTDARAIDDFSKLVQSRERLRLLLVLTVADIRGVGPNVWNGWKGQLLRDLYFATEAVLEGGQATLAREVRAAEARAEAAARLRSWDEPAVDRLMRRLDDPYWIAFDGATHKRHADLIQTADTQRGKGAPPLAYDTRTDQFTAVTTLAVVTDDRPGLFALLTGTIAAAGASIVDAKAYTTRDGLGVDTFALQDTLSGAFAEPDKLEKLEALLEEAIRTGQVPKNGARPRLKRRERAFSVEPHVFIENGASDTFTVVEVAGRDRPGLLHDLASALSDLRVSIGSAHVATYGERAVDVFYVRDAFGLKIVKESALRVVSDRLHAALQDPGEA